MATEVVKTIRASGGDYSSLAAWEAGEQRDLVAADEIAVAECYNDWPNGHNYGGGVDVNGWSADYYCYVVVRAAPGHGHNGVRGAGFRLEGGWGVPITLSTPYSVVQDIEAVGPGYTAAIELKGNTCKVQRCIAEGSSETINSSSVGGIIESCISYSSYAPWSGTGYYLSGLYGHVRHCMSVGAREGFYFRRPQTATNCIAYGAAVPFSGEDPAANWSGNNAATVALGSKAGPSPHPYLITSADFTDAANGDFSLSATSTLSGAGRYLAGAVDITGVSFVAPVSIGPFENSIGGGLTPVSGSGSHQAQGSSHSGSGERIVIGAGSHQSQNASHSGIGGASGQISGSGSHQAGTATHSGAGERVVVGSGAHQADSSTHAGIGERVISGSGSHQAGTATHSGAGVIDGIVSGSGSHQSQTATHSGAGERIITGLGLHQSGSATHSGTGSVPVPIGSLDVDTLAAAIAEKIGSLGIDEVTLNRVVQGAIPAPASEAGIAKELLRLLPKPHDYTKTLKSIEQRLARLEKPKPESNRLTTLSQELVNIKEVIRTLPQPERVDLSPVIEQLDGIEAMFTEAPDNTDQIDAVKVQLAELEEALSSNEATIIEAIAGIPQADLSSIATTSEIAAVKALLNKLQNYNDTSVLSLLEQLRDNGDTLRDTQDRTEKKTDLLLDNQLKF